MQDAFINGTEEAWEQLLELTGAADQADGREGAPCINIQHRATGTVLILTTSWAHPTTIIQFGNFCVSSVFHTRLPQFDMPRPACVELGTLCQSLSRSESHLLWNVCGS